MWQQNKLNRWLEFCNYYGYTKTTLSHNCFRVQTQSLYFNVAAIFFFSPEYLGYCVSSPFIQVVFGIYELSWIFGEK